MEVDELEPEEGNESDSSSHGIVNGMISEVEEKNLNILGNASFRDIPVLDHFGLKSSKKEVLLSRTRMGFSV